MILESASELVGLIATVVAFVPCVAGIRRGAFAGTATVLLALLLVNLGNYSVNFMEWAEVDVGLNLDAIEDTFDLISPLVWWFYLYACCQNITAVRLRSSIVERERMESQAAESEARLRAVLESDNARIYNIDGKGNVIFANRIHDRETIGQSIRQFLPVDSEEPVREALERVFQNGEPEAFALVEPTREGSDIHLNCRLAPVRSEGRVISAILVATDITDLKLAEEELRDSEQRFRTLVEHAPECIVVIDIDADRFVDFNQQALDFFKLDSKQMLQASLLDLSPPLQPCSRSSAEILKELCDTAMHNGSPSAAWTCRNGDGEELACHLRLVRLPSARRRLLRGSVTLMQFT